MFNNRQTKIKERVNAYIDANKIDISVFNPQTYEEIVLKANEYLRDHINGNDEKWFVSYIMDSDYPVYYSPASLLVNNDDIATTSFNRMDNEQCIVVGDLFNLFDTKCQEDILLYLSFVIDRKENNGYLNTTDLEYDGYSLSPWLELNIEPIDGEEWMEIYDYKIYCHLVAALHAGVENYTIRLNYIHEMCKRLGIEMDNKFFRKLNFELSTLKFIMIKYEELKDKV